MQKQLFLFIILLLVNCNKTETTRGSSSKTTDSIAIISGDDTLTEADAGKLFDKFGVEFQSAVVDEDTNRILEMCDTTDIYGDGFLSHLFHQKVKTIIEKMNKSNRYCYNDTTGTINISYNKNYIMYTEIYFYGMRFNGSGGCLESIGTFGLRNGKMKLIEFNVL